MHSILLLMHYQSTIPLHILYNAVVIGFLRRWGIRDFVGTLQQIRNSVVGEMWGNIKSISYGQCVQFLSCCNRKVCLLIVQFFHQGLSGNTLFMKEFCFNIKP